MRPVRVVLFGSVARGEADERSDLDVIVVAEDVPDRFGKRTVHARGLVGPRSYPRDIFVYTSDEYAGMLDRGNPFVRNAEREGSRPP